jgi:hypothetical protein
MFEQLAGVKALLQAVALNLPVFPKTATTILFQGEAFRPG